MDYEATVKALDELWKRTTSEPDAAVFWAAISYLIALRNDLSNEQVARQSLEVRIKNICALEPSVGDDGDYGEGYTDGYTAALELVRATLGVE